METIDEVLDVRGDIYQKEIRITQNIGILTAMLSTFSELITANLITSNVLLSKNNYTLLFAVFSSFVFSYFIGKYGGERIIMQKRNFTIWIWYGFLTMWFSILMGMIFHSIIESSSISDFLSGLFFFLFFMTIYSLIPIFIIGSILGYFIKYLGNNFKIKQNEH